MSTRRIDEIKVGKRFRPKRDEHVDSLAASIAEVGLLQPVVITPTGELVAGYHRLLACTKLGWRDIPTRTVAMEELDQRIAELDENLVRNELNALERAEHLAERKKLYESRHPEAKSTRAGGPGRGKAKLSTDSGLSAPAPAFIDDAAARTARSRTQIAEEVRLAEQLCPDVRDMLRDTPTADNKQELKRLSKAPPAKQRELATAIATGKAKGVRQATKQSVARQIRAEPPPMPTGPFRVAVIDPPWPYEARPDDSTQRGAITYPPMPIDEICALPVAEMMHEDAIVWLWVTNAFLWEAFALVLPAWGFPPKTMLTWDKMRIGAGDWLRGQTEHAIMAVRGEPVVLLTNQSTIIRAARREHSRKPDEFYALVDELCPGSKVELFAREEREGWRSWGGEVGLFEPEPQRALGGVR